LTTRDVNAEVVSTYSELKGFLLEKDCKLVSEEPPKRIVVQHGSLRGVSPRNVKKVIEYQICPHNSGSRIVSKSSISSDWINLTLWGSVGAGVVAVLFWWIASDITDLLMNGGNGYWVWLAEAFGYPNVQYAFFMVNITKILSVVLLVTIILEILDVFIVHRRINSFAEETLDELTKKQYSLQE
jgi:hypothetical protein